MQRACDPLDTERRQTQPLVTEGFNVDCGKKGSSTFEVKGCLDPLEGNAEKIHCVLKEEVHLCSRNAQSAQRRKFHISSKAGPWSRHGSIGTFTVVCITVMRVARVAGALDELLLPCHLRLQFPHLVSRLQETLHQHQGLQGRQVSGRLSNLKVLLSDGYVQPAPTEVHRRPPSGLWVTTIVKLGDSGCAALMI